MTSRRFAFRFDPAYRLAGLPFTDSGVTFATNGERGVCVTFHEPVRAIDPAGLITHPGATFTVADVEGLVDALGGSAS
jgi:hypothetical protein